MSTAEAAVSHRKLSQQEVDLICAKHERLWASKPGGARAVFSWADLSGLDLSGRNLADADFTGAILAGTNLSKARLDHATLFGADLQEARLVGASLKRADLRACCLRGANLTNADLFEADLREGLIAAVDKEKGLRVVETTKRVSEAYGAILAGANLERSRLSGVVAVRADFSDAVMKDAKLVRANLKQATLNGADLAGADLSGADLSGADLRDAVLAGARTTACKFDDADLTGVLTDDPSGTDVSGMPYDKMLRDHALWCETQGAQGAPSAFDGADLRRLATIKGLNLTALSAKGAVFYGLDMEGVQLQGARLEGADLRSCNLRRADLRGARLTGARLTGSDLREAQLGPLLISHDRVMPCDLTGAVLKGADLSRADLRYALLTRADLTRANFTGAAMRHADITEAQLSSAKGLETLF